MLIADVRADRPRPGPLAHVAGRRADPCASGCARCRAPTSSSSPRPRRSDDLDRRRCRSSSTRSSRAYAHPTSDWTSLYRVNIRMADRYRVGPGLPGRGRRARALAGRRAGPEHRHPGRLQPRLEAGRPGRRAARHLRGRTPSGRRGRARSQHPAVPPARLERGGRHAPGRPGAAPAEPDLRTATIPDRGCARATGRRTRRAARPRSSTCCAVHTGRCWCWAYRRPSFRRRP